MATFTNSRRNGNRADDINLTWIERLRSLLWSVEQAPLAMLALAKQKQWVDAQTAISLQTTETLANIAQQWQIDLDPTTIPYMEVDSFIQHAGPTLVQVKVNELSGWLVIVKGGRRRVLLMATDGSPQTISADLFRFALCHQLENPWEAEITSNLSEWGTPPRRHTDLRQALLDKVLATATIKPCWQLSLAPSADLLARVQEQRLPQLFGIISLLQFALSNLNYGIAALIAFITFNTVIEWSWIWLACLLLLLRIPLELLNHWVTSVYNMMLVIFIKTRLLYGILQLTPEETRRFGTGQFLAWGLEAMSLNTLGNIITNMIRSLIALGAVAAILTIVSSPIIVLYLAGWIVTAVTGGWWLYRLRHTYETYHAEMINGIMERMQGHQTRLMQENDWFSDDDQVMAGYFDLIRRYDRFESFFVSWMPMAWTIGSLAILSLSFIEQPTQQVAIGFAAILFTKLEAASIAKTIIAIVEAVSAWRLIAPIEQGARQSPAESVQDIAVLRPKTARIGQEMMNMQNVTFRYPEGDSAVFHGASLRIQVGDRILLEGPSGGGKSTLALLLAGSYAPQKGLLLLWSLDKYALGSTRWRKWVVYVPQYHQNHIISASLAFNLLMGNEWPPSPESLVEAETICRELGLGSLLDRMPHGLDQRIGERGWNLSQGERSRVYIARALLQQPDLMVLDESFASLDPESLGIALKTVLRRAKTLLVIAHP